MKKATNPNGLLDNYFKENKSHALYTDGNKISDPNKSVGLVSMPTSIKKSGQSYFYCRMCSYFKSITAHYSKSVHKFYNSYRFAKRTSKSKFSKNECKSKLLHS